MLLKKYEDRYLFCVIFCTLTTLININNNNMFEMRIPVLFLLLVCASFVSSQELARFTVKPVEGAGVSLVAIPLDAIVFNTDQGRLAVFDSADPEIEIESQLETGVLPKLWIRFDNGKGEKSFILKMVAGDNEQNIIPSVETIENKSILRLGGNPVLSYNHADVLPPDGADMNYRRSAFIHPLWSPGGAVLTNIQPDDHLHHYGIWNPWTRTTIDHGGNQYNVDFWNLGQGEGRVQFKGYLGTEKGPVYAGLKALHEHVSYVMEEEGKELLAVNEVWDVRTWKPGVKNVYVVDLTTTLNTPLPNGIMFNEYRYGGGIGYRATEKWQRHNSRVLTSEGKTRINTDATNARWCIIEGETDTDKGQSGILFLSHPANRMHPEPMRMWDENAAGGTGQIFFQFTPIRHSDWKIEPATSYTLKYRMVVYDGEMTAEEAEQYWKAFAVSPVVRFHSSGW
jgi:hypothetical protein